MKITPIDQWKLSNRTAQSNPMVETPANEEVFEIGDRVVVWNVIFTESTEGAVSGRDVVYHISFPSDVNSEKFSADHTYPPEQLELIQSKKSTRIAQRAGIEDSDEGDQSRVALVYQNHNGFVTDFGKDLTLTGSQTGDIIVPRYGVWRHDPAKGKPQVVFTTSDLEEAKSKLAD